MALSSRFLFFSTGYPSLRRLQQRKKKARKKETLQKSYANFNVEGLQMLKLLMKLFILTRSGDNAILSWNSCAKTITGLPKKLLNLGLLGKMQVL
ncbi:hypothetical protein LXL04_036283 [Taraxacum kok-saghyz]